MNTSSPTTPPSAGHRAAALRAEHQRIRDSFEDLENRASSGDWRECDAVWEGFCRTLLHHLRFEEEHLFPRYARSSAEAAAEVAALRAEHDGIRADLERMGVDLQLHLTRADRLREFVDALRAHAWHEDQTFYPWLAEQPASAATELPRS